MSLAEQLRTTWAQASEHIPDEVMTVMNRSARALAESRIAEEALAAGDKAPNFTLPSARGGRVALAELLEHGPVVLTFYRGAWCPFCDLALRALGEINEQIAQRGASLVAVSPQIPDESLSLQQKHRLEFEVLSDVGLDTAKQFGIAFDLTEELGALYDRLGFELRRVNGGHARSLPLPASYLITPDGTIRWAFVDTDYSKRAEPADILAELDELVTVGS